MIIYEVSTKKRNNHGMITGYTDRKFYLLRDNADKDWHERLDRGEDAAYFIRHTENEDFRVE